ncbi:MAG: hypothetical protein C0518_11905 [Opitutus sp.]|nr:hypothetical protein [Opitutus sp.]
MPARATRSASESPSPRWALPNTSVKLSSREMRGIRHPSPHSAPPASRQKSRAGAATEREFDEPREARHARRMSPRNFVLLSVLAIGTVLGAAEKPKVTAFERSQGWRLLFDGRDASDWRGYRANKLPANWQVADGSLVGTTGAALVSAEEFGDFEVSFDWKVGEGGHGEFFYRVTEDAASPELSGLQMHLAGHGPALGGNGFGAPERTVTPQFDVWYRAKIVVFGNLAEHWLNGERVHVYTIDSAEWRKAVAATAFSTARDLGQARTGRLALSGERVEFRNIKVRAL